MLFASDSHSLTSFQKGEVKWDELLLNSSVSFCIIRIFTIALILILSLSMLHGQDSTQAFFKIKTVDSNLDLSPKTKKKIENSFKKATDSIGVVELGRQAESELAAQGYLEANFENFARENQNLTLKFFQGPVYILDQIELQGLNESEFEQQSYQKIARKKVVFDWQDINQRLRQNLYHYQSNGYPFAKFDSLEMAYHKQGDTLLTQIQYQFQPGKLVRIDSVLIKGDVREKSSFVQGLIGIYAGEIFDQAALDRAPKILNNSIYFKNVKPVEIEFVDEEKAKVIVNLESKKAGKFDLLLGILPPVDESSKLQFTGLVDFQLVSPLFRSGEIIEFRFDKLTGSSQKLKLRYAQPYLFGSPLRVDFELDLLKQDTTFLTRFLRFGTGYALSPNLSLKVFYKNKTSTLIATKHYDSLSPPPVLDAKDQTYGLGFSFQNLDYRFNPRKGMVIEARFGLGRKRIIDNPTLDDRIYTGLTLKMPKREASLKVQWFQNYTKRLVLMLGNQSYWLDQPEYFENDLKQVGGSRSIRGFDENQFFTNFYSQFTIENRFLLEQNSYLFVFSDYAYLENKAEKNQILRPWGFGLGMTYETGAGMVSVTYAVGRVAEFPFQPSRGRIHVGLINQF